MRITGCETFPISLPFRAPYITANGTIGSREMAVLRISAEGGMVGYGDAVPMSLRGGPGLDRVLADLDRAAAGTLAGAGLEGDADVRTLLAACADRDISSAALAAIDVALLDLLGRATGLPAWQILGAGRVAPVECNGTLGGGEPDAVAADAAELAGRGFRALKIKVGIGDDRGRVAAVRAAVGPDVALRVDANGAWSIAQAREELRGIAASAQLELAEQPCSSLEEMAELRALSDVAIVADESVATADDATRAVAIGACDAATLKLAKVGGPHAALTIAGAIPAYLSSALDSAIGIAAAAHTALALPTTGLAHGLATSSLFADDVVAGGRFGGPRLDPGSSPGLGVDVDPAALERLAIR